ncbi:MAG: LD-carboxypeptidase [Lachnospiraceae bacterium]
MLKSGDKVGIVCCSNGQGTEQKGIIEQLTIQLQELGLKPEFSPYLYKMSEESVFSGTARQRADALMEFYKNPGIVAIFDISGGDVANMLLPYLDYDVIAKNPKPFWGYSDLTTILNAIYTRTGNRGVLYQVKNIVWDESGEQKIRMKKYIENIWERGREANLFGFRYRFLQGESMEGIVMGGNIRCLLKLAGTEYWPDMHGKILLLEGMGGGAAQYAAYLAQLNQLHVFEQVEGILLGTFTQMEREGQTPAVEDMLFTLLHNSDQERVRKLPVAKTKDIGHGTDAKAIEIGTGLVLLR